MLFGAGLRDDVIEFLAPEAEFVPGARGRGEQGALARADDAGRLIRHRDSERAHAAGDVGDRRGDGRLHFRGRTERQQGRANLVVAERRSGKRLIDRCGVALKAELGGRLAPEGDLQALRRDVARRHIERLTVGGKRPFQKEWERRTAVQLGGGAEIREVHISRRR